jgi:hypothetical protein
MTNKNNNIEKKLDTVIELLRIQVALELYKSGQTMDQICKRLRIGKVKVVEMLKGIKKDK